MKPLLIISILCLLLCFTGRSQNISIENNKLCFDSSACVLLYKTILDRDGKVAELKLYEELYSSYDSLIAAQESYKTILRNDVARLYTNNQNLQLKQNNIVADAKKGKRRAFWTGTSIGTTIAVLSVLLLQSKPL